MKRLWARLKQLSTMQLTREELLMKLGAARDQSRIAWRLAVIEVAADCATFSYRLDHNKLRQTRSREGRYLLRTNLVEEDPAKLWSHHLLLVAVEEAFKNLKGDLAIRPVFQQLETRVEAHVFIALLAYCLHGAAGPPGAERRTDPASLLMMIYIERLALRRMSYVAAGLAVLVGSVGLAMAAPAFSIVFATLVGFSLGCLLTMALALPPLTVIPEEIPSFSAAVFTVSYTVAVCVALLIGVIETFGPSRSMSVLPLAAAALAVVLIGATVRSLVPTGAGPKSKL